MPREAVSLFRSRFRVPSLVFVSLLIEITRVENSCAKKRQWCAVAAACVCGRSSDYTDYLSPPPQKKKFPGAMSEALCVCALGSVRLFNGNVVLYANKGTTRPTVTKHATVLYLYLYCTCTTVLALALYCTVLYF